MSERDEEEVPGLEPGGRDNTSADGNDAEQPESSSRPESAEAGGKPGDPGPWRPPPPVERSSPRNMDYAEARAAEYEHADGPGMDVSHMIKAVGGILWDPLKGPEWGFPNSTRQRVVDGVVFGGLCLAGYVLGAWLPRNSDFRPGLLKFVPGCLLFLATATATSWALRRFLDKNGEAKWQTDAYIVGCSALLLGAGALIGLLVPIGGGAFMGAVILTLKLTAIVLAAFALDGGLVRVGGVPESAAVWYTVVVLGVAQLVAGFLDFGVLY